MANTVTLRLDTKLERALDRACRKRGVTRSQMVRDALRRQLQRLEFEELRAQLVPLAEAAGWVTDEDIFREVS
jgi:metal-responsive CopG/Arc/MetJ family transcriptional regulator